MPPFFPPFAPDSEIFCAPLPAWGTPVGVIMGVFGSVGINLGQNLQASGIHELPEELRMKPHKSKKWVVGLSIFIAFSMLNFAALALAPASILTPLESIQFVTNIAWNRIVNRKVISQRMLVGVTSALVGTVLSVVFGAPGGACHSLSTLEGYWTGGGWWGYVVTTMLIAGASLWYHTDGARRAKDGMSAPSSAVLLPITYTLAAALMGGAQMIVHSKVFSELLAMLFQGDLTPLTSWILYLEFGLVTLCGVLWAFRLTECLALYDPLLILPLMVGTYILFGGIAGGIFFHEFAVLHEGPADVGGWPLYLFGMLLVLIGLGLIAGAGTDGSSRVAPEDNGGGAATGTAAAEASTNVPPAPMHVVDLTAPRSARSTPLSTPQLMASVSEGSERAELADDGVHDAVVRCSPAVASSAEVEWGTTAGATAVETRPAITRVKELSVLTPEVALLALKERSTSLLYEQMRSPSSSASHMPTPVAMLRCTQQLVNVRRALDALSQPASPVLSSVHSANRFVRVTPPFLTPAPSACRPVGVRGGLGGNVRAMWPLGSNRPSQSSSPRVVDPSVGSSVSSTTPVERFKLSPADDA